MYGGGGVWGGRKKREYCLYEEKKRNLVYVFKVYRISYNYKFKNYN